MLVPSPTRSSDSPLKLADVPNHGTPEIALSQPDVRALRALAEEVRDNVRRLCKGLARQEAQLERIAASLGNVSAGIGAKLDQVLAAVSECSDRAEQIAGSRGWSPASPKPPR
jgi:hypothetical protein